MKWAYGLVQEKEGLVLCEIYFKDIKDEPVMYVPVDWEEINSNKQTKQVIKDIKQQIKHKRFLKKEDF